MHYTYALFDAVAAAHLSLYYIIEFGADELLADWRHMIREDLAAEMIEFMLYDARGKPSEFLLMGLEVFVEPAEHHMLISLHILVDTRDREATFGTTDRLFIFYHFELGIDAGQFQILAFGEIIRQRRAVDDQHADGLADLRSGKADAVTGIHRLIHIGHELLNLRIVGRDILAYLAQDGLAEQIYW